MNLPQLTALPPGLADPGLGFSGDLFPASAAFNAAGTR